MRPSPTIADANVHECLECGSRFESPKTRDCDGCGGELRSLGKARDL